MYLRRSFGSAILFCFVLSVLPMMGQAPQDKSSRPQPGNRPGQGGGKPGGGRPGGNNGDRPNPGGGNNGGNRPNPGTNPGNRPGSGNRPNPGGNRPNPGGNRPGAGRPNPSRPGAGRPNPGRPGRPPQWGHRPQNRPSYNFRPMDRDYLRRYYMGRFGLINRARRPHFMLGGFIPYGDIPYISVLPADLYGQLPPPPPGYSVGYYDGYVVVYDPVTYFIANVIDLLQ